MIIFVYLPYDGSARRQKATDKKKLRSFECFLFVYVCIFAFVFILHEFYYFMMKYLLFSPENIPHIIQYTGSNLTVSK